MLDGLYIEIGSRIRLERNKKHISQAKLAELVGLKRTSIINIEKGRQRFLIHTLYGFAEALGIRPHELIPDSIPASSGDKIPDGLSGEEEKWFKSIVGGYKNGNSQKKN